MAKYDKTKKYWLQLKEDWFDEDAIKWIEDQKNGIEYSHFYMKLMLKSIKTNGYLIRQVGKMLVPYNPEALADLTRTNIDTVTVAMDLLVKIGLVEFLEDGTIFIEQVQKLIGCTTVGAERKALQRGNFNIEKLGWTNGGQMSTKDKDKDINNIYSSSANYNESKSEETLQEENDNLFLLGNNEKKKQNEKEVIDDNKQLFDYWNSKNIVVHKTLNEELNNNIIKFLKKHKLEEFKVMVDRYKQILDDKKYFFNYKWSLKDFLNRKNGAVDFMDEGSKWQDYCNKVGVQTKQETMTQVEEGVFRL